MRILMKATRYGSPDGIKVNEYVVDEGYDVPVDLGIDFIAAGFAESAEPKEAQALTWPPTDEQLGEMSFSALGVLLEGKGVALGALKSVDARLDAVRQLIAETNKPPAVVLPTDEEIDGMDESSLSVLLAAREIDVARISTVEEGRAKLKELIAIERAAQE